ncbi:efflux RND transporter periplasmic adaptor subunit [Nitrogeniibacter mangrovi]|uniref:Efflux RND transporter periplasmic adaptor subunit n=1 Tax=Nitrogeniibacter mangrovi TaxID=2016596 RepID=A0A6C1B8B2_9RHOO|nr:efflux RND transporter periplasmic adaptor subunit [Nitrogeniibacter mangrovi]QID19179.1 efflux RND transporter periplasmic adaptor subunit [Nitrogeniibacter mangrovi]
MTEQRPQAQRLPALDLGPSHAPGRARWIGWVIVALLVAGVAAWWLSAGSGNGVTRYRTTAVATSDLTVTVSATGTLQPTNKVDVGSELSGIITHVLVEDNDTVRAGQVIAQLDTAKLKDAITSARASLESAQAGVLQAEATVSESASNLARLQEVARLSGGKVPSRAELDTGRAALARARADLAAAKATVTERRATLSTAETNLAKAAIKSPINGVVLSRDVEPGQTVAASLQAPVLFTLAEDLAQMELQVNVDEADVGQVAEGQQATFSVDAYPNRRYPAQITRVSYGAQTTDNVVSYLTTLKVDNDDLSLRPGMTATAEIVTTTKTHVLVVPNAALRFTPPTTTRESGSVVSRLMPRPPRPREAKTVKPADGSTARQVWVLRDNVPVAVPVTIGVTDGRVTEIVGGALKAGEAVITDTLSASR